MLLIIRLVMSDSRNSRLIGPKRMRREVSYSNVVMMYVQPFQSSLFVQKSSKVAKLSDSRYLHTAQRAMTTPTMVPV